MHACANDATQTDAHDLALHGDNVGSRRTIAHQHVVRLGQHAATVDGNFVAAGVWPPRMLPERGGARVLVETRNKIEAPKHGRLQITAAPGQKARFSHAQLVLPDTRRSWDPTL